MKKIFLKIFVKLLKNTYFYRTPPPAYSVFQNQPSQPPLSVCFVKFECIISIEELASKVMQKR